MGLSLRSSSLCLGGAPQSAALLTRGGDVDPPPPTPSHFLGIDSVTVVVRRDDQLITVNGTATGFAPDRAVYAVAKQPPPTSADTWFVSNEATPNRQGHWSAKIVATAVGAAALTVTAVETRAGTAGACYHACAEGQQLFEELASYGPRLAHPKFWGRGVISAPFTTEPPG